MADDDTTFETSRTVVLRAPIQLTETQPLITELQLYEPTLAQMASAVDVSGGNQIRYTGNLIAAITKQPYALIQKMGARDFAECRSFLDKFFADVP